MQVSAHLPALRHWLPPVVVFGFPTHWAAFLSFLRVLCWGFLPAPVLALASGAQL